MDQSWRFRPIQGNNICPNCSISHFPFCPNPSQTYPQFPNDPSLFQHRPLYDPFLDNRAMHHHAIPNPIDVYGIAKQPWDGSLGYESDRVHKKMRFDEPGGVGGYGSNVRRNLTDDERRLNLIREHGGPSSVQWVDSSFRTGSGYANNGGNQQFDGTLQRIEGQLNTSNANSFQDPIFSPREQVFDTQYNVGRDHRLQYSQEINENFTQSGGRDYDLMRGGMSNAHHELHQGNSHYGGYIDPAMRSQSRSVISPSAPKGRDMYQQDNWASPNLQPYLPHCVPYPISQDTSEKYNAHSLRQLQPNDINQEYELKNPHKRLLSENVHSQVSPRVVEQFGAHNVNKQGAHMSAANVVALQKQGQVLDSRIFGSHSSVPPLPPTPRPVDPPPPPHLQTTVSFPSIPSSVYPIPVSLSTNLPLLRPSALECQPFAPKHPSPENVKIIDASHLFRQPYQATRPDHIVVILRGLPGSGKSYLAKMLRDLEVENGGNAPRIHSMDDYFMAEVEKVEEIEGSKASASFKSKKRITKKVMEYCYEPEMEEAYRSSMLKAFKKTLEEGVFTFIIVDDRNLRVADFAQFWANAKRSGYEVYLLEATYKDPVGCAARNIHGFTSDDIQKMAKLWEESPSLYLRLDIQSLHHGDNFKDSGIQEVDMDMEMDVEDGSGNECPSDRNSLKTAEPSDVEYAPEGSKDGDKWDTEGEDRIRVKELEKSKWSHDVDEEDNDRLYAAKKNSNALSGLVRFYKGDKSVHWSDENGKTGFSIGAAKKANVLSLVIGPGSGYNLKSNPLPAEVTGAVQTNAEPKKHSVFQDALRAEHESFCVVFDRRRQRIGGLAIDDE
ncbi:hypothetical protein GIB67_033037 [Kingdonia uniflora]|uniref:YLP motif-containing protein 1 n=1 Tax=Kingdonia uniflora TaxID=39325 RepID=A0A7J7MYJ9_9MAGN|nr:hypothetical protein GIB67_033037 [Kingdonia uniflora]